MLEEEIAAEERAEDAAASRQRPPSALRSLVEWIAVIGGALAVALLIKTFLFQAFYIPSDSMVPTLQVGDRVLVNKVSYDLHDVNRGDLVVFSRPPNTPGSADDLIKRVIGLPGDEISLVGDTITINGQSLVEPYLPDEVVTCCLTPITVPEGHVFVMGDNRGDSYDSRRFGPIPVSSIVGRAFVRVWPPSRVGGL
jgi:signal peptidase I